MGASLEAYHLPRWARFFLRQVCAQYAPKDDNGRNSMDEDVLLAAAQKRAAMLRSRLGIQETATTLPDAKGQPGGAGSAVSSHAPGRQVV